VAQYTNKKADALMAGLPGFWRLFFKDSRDIEGFLEASNQYLGQLYLDLMSSVLGTSLADTPVLNKENWKLLTIDETDINTVSRYNDQGETYDFSFPENYVDLDILQDSIIMPSLVMEKGVDFDVDTDKRVLKFYKDPFKGLIDSNTQHMLPEEGTPTRLIRKSSGSAIKDLNTTNFSRDTKAGKGDLLRIHAYGLKITYEGTGARVLSDGTFIFPTSLDCKKNDIIEITGASEDKFITNYWVKSNDGATLTVHRDTLGFPKVDSDSSLVYRIWQGAYTADAENINVVSFNGDLSLKTALDTSRYSNVPIVFSLVRDPYNPYVKGEPVNWSSTGGSSTYPIQTQLSKKQLVKGTVFVGARRFDGSLVVEDVDYTLDYTRGIFYQLQPWRSTSNGTIAYEYTLQVLLSAGGHLQASKSTEIQQIGMWVPEVKVDRETLWYNYGSLVGYKRPSTENYKQFLQGLIALYVGGPVFQRMESAMNIVAGYSICSTDKEILKGYHNSKLGEGTGAIVTPVDSFVTLNISDYVVSNEDVGRVFIVVSGTTDSLLGHYLIDEVRISDNAIKPAFTYGAIDDTVSWELVSEYKQTVITDKQEYTFPYNVPIREDVTNTDNIGTLVFNLFEAFTTAFKVVDYLEDATWWYDTHIPDTLWTKALLSRRKVSTLLYENVFGADDDAHFDDPGLYFGADDMGKPGRYRHKASYIIFDKYLKQHTFMVNIAKNLELDGDTLSIIQDSVLSVKPAYTYPVITPHTSFDDGIVLSDTFALSNIALLLGQQENNIGINGHELYFNAEDEWTFGSYYSYHKVTDHVVAGTPQVPITTGTHIDLSTYFNTQRRPYLLVLKDTCNGKPLTENIDYTFNWRTFQLTALTDWDGNTFPLIDFWMVVTYPYYSSDTRDGDTPICIGGLNPYYIRNEGSAGCIDRALQLTIDPGTGTTYPY